MIIINHVLENPINTEEYNKTVEKICKIAKEKIIVVWSTCPKIVIGSKSKADFEITASETFKEFLKNDFQLEQISWGEKCIWIFEPNDNKTY